MVLSDSCWLKDKCNKIKRDDSCLKSSVFCIKQFKLDCLYNLSLLPYNKRNHVDLLLDKSKIDLIAFNKLKEIQDNIENFVVADINNLYIYSNNTGNGKTEWAVRLIQSYFNKVWPKSDITCKALFISIPRYLLEIKDNINQKSDYISFIKENVYRADIVVWDDIGTKSATSFEHENLLSILDNRLNNKKCNIFTSNISPNDLSEVVGDRLYSRIINNSIPIEFKGLDKRGMPLL